MNNTNTTQKQPDLILEFSKGDYDHVLRCYESAKQWAVETGQAYRQDLYGRILPPDHPQSPHEEKLAPFHLLDDPHWIIRAQIFTSTEEVFNWIMGLPLPENSNLIVCERGIQ